MMTTPESQSTRTLPADEKRRRIFDAARDVIMRRGYDSATMEEIAARAGVGKGTLYNFFDSKEDLFLSVVMDGFERIREGVDARVDPIEDPWERFEVGWRTLMLDVFPQLNQQWSFIYQIWGVVARDEAARERMFTEWRNLYRNREGLISTAISEGQRSGRFQKHVSATSISLLLMAAFDGLLHRAMFDPERVVPEEALRAVLDLVRVALQPEGPTPGKAPGAARQARRAPQ